MSRRPGPKGAAAGTARRPGVHLEEWKARRFIFARDKTNCEIPIYNSYLPTKSDTGVNLNSSLLRRSNDWKLWWGKARGVKFSWSLKCHQHFILISTRNQRLPKPAPRDRAVPRWQIWMLHASPVPLWNAFVWKQTKVTYLRKPLHTHTALTLMWFTSNPRQGHRILRGHQIYHYEVSLMPRPCLPQGLHSDIEVKVRSLSPGWKL